MYFSKNLRLYVVKNHQIFSKTRNVKKCVLCFKRLYKRLETKNYKIKNTKQKNLNTNDPDGEQNNQSNLLSLHSYFLEMRKSTQDEVEEMEEEVVEQD